MTPIFETIHADACSVCVVAGLLLFVGNQMVQSQQRARLIGKRLGAFAFVGCLVYGWPVLHEGADIMHIALDSLIAAAITTSIAWILLPLVWFGDKP
jgi:uncharacterized membrane protein YccC